MVVGKVGWETRESTFLDLLWTVLLREIQVPKLNKQLFAWSNSHEKILLAINHLSNLTCPQAVNPCWRLFYLFDLRPCQHNNGYLDDRSQIKVPDTGSQRSVFPGGHPSRY